MATPAAKKGLPKIGVAIDIAAMRRGVVQALMRLKPGRKKPLGAPEDGERTLSTEIDVSVGRHLVTRQIKTTMGTLATANRRHRLARNAALASPFLLVGAVAAWLVMGAEETERALEAAVPRVIVPVYAPDSGGVIHSDPAKASAAPVVVNSPYDPVPMIAAPAPGLIEETPRGPLPMVASDGRTPWQVYARPFFHDDKRPRIALVVAGLGISPASTIRAIEGLPGAVTLAFAPTADQLGVWVDQGRRLGHEVMLELPMEPVEFPRIDPGPNTMLVALDAERNVQRLQTVLGRVTGYVGVTSLTGSRFTGTGEPIRPILAEVNKRGLMFLDSRTAPRSVATREATKLGLPRALSDSFIDRVPSRGAIDAELRLLEEAAQIDGAAVGIAMPYPVTLERLSQWIKTLEGKGIVLAPITALVNKQADR